MKRNYFNYPVFKVSVLALTALLINACGSKITSTSGLSSLGTLQATSTSTGVTTSDSCANSGTNVYNLQNATTSSIEITGATGATPTATVGPLATSRTLKVKVTPQSAPNLQLAGYQNWVFPYGCLSLSVTVNGVTQQTSVLRVESATQSATSQCASAPTSQVLDFSNAITGNGTVNVVVSNANYDNCRPTNNPFIYGCSMSALYQTHEAAANVQVQTDGTYMCY